MRLARKILYQFGITASDSLIFFGSGKMAFPSLKLLHERYSNLSVVTHASQKQGKSFNEVENYCVEQKVPWSSPIMSKNSKQKRMAEWESYIDTLKKPTFGVICSYGYLLPSRLIAQFQKGAIVVHPSLLPKYRGGAPIFHAIANGQSVSGVSYIQISKKVFDNGNILHQTQRQISRTEYYNVIEAELAEEAAKHLPYVLDNIDKLRPGTSQKELQVGIPAHLLKAPLVKTKLLDINQPADHFYNWSRAIVTPHLLFTAKNSQIILKLKNEYIQGEAQVGTFKVVGKKLFLRCQDKFVRVSSYYQASRKEMPAGVFIAEFIKSGKFPLQSVRVQSLTQQKPN